MNITLFLCLFLQLPFSIHVNQRGSSSPAHQVEASINKGRHVLAEAVSKGFFSNALWVKVKVNYVRK